MKKALLMTDGSVDMAMSLNQWLNTQPEPIDLTVVYTFTLNQTAGQPLKAAVYREARETATEDLNRWLNFLPQPCSDQSRPGQSSLSQLHTEILLGGPELVLALHLLLRRYDYLLIDVWQKGFVSAFKSFQGRISTQLRYLGLPEGVVCPLNLIQETEYGLPFIPVNSKSAA